MAEESCIIIPKYNSNQLDVHCTCHVHNFNPPSSVHFPIPINPPPRLLVISNTYNENPSQSSTICIYQNFQREKSLQGFLAILERGTFLVSFANTSVVLEREMFLVFFAKIIVNLERGTLLIFFANTSANLERGTFLVFFVKISAVLER